MVRFVAKLNRPLLLVALVVATIAMCIRSAGTTHTVFAEAFMATASPTLGTVQTARDDGAELLYSETGKASVQNGQFSPDGADILFTLFHNGYNRGPAGLYRLNIAKRVVVRLLDEPDHDSVNLPGSSWLKATGQIVFASDRADGLTEIWSLAPDTKLLKRITDHLAMNAIYVFTEPSLSPDGRQIVFEADLDNDVSTLWLVDADGTHLKNLMPGSKDKQPNWSPSGDKILFQRQLSDGRWNLYTVRPDGENIRPALAETADDTDASWSPDGKWIVYSSTYGGRSHPAIFVAPVGGKPIQITYADAYSDYAPSWSPDGKWLLFESRQGDN